MDSGYSPWDCKEEDRTERLTHTHKVRLKNDKANEGELRWT